MSTSAADNSACIFLFSSDLMLISSVSGAAALAGLQFFSGTDLTELRMRIARQSVLLCFDLGNPVSEPLQIAETLPPDQIRQSIAFGPHVHTARLEMARQAGFGKVMSRGQFVSRMREEFLQFCRR